MLWEATGQFITRLSMQEEVPLSIQSTRGSVMLAESRKHVGNRRYCSGCFRRTVRLRLSKKQFAGIIILVLRQNSPSLMGTSGLLHRSRPVLSLRCLISMDGCFWKPINNMAYSDCLPAHPDGPLSGKHRMPGIP